MPCLHQFCYLCIMPKNSPCKRRVTTILHSVQGDNDFEEQVITPSAAPSVTTHLTGSSDTQPPTISMALQHPSYQLQGWCPGLLCLASILTSRCCSSDSTQFCSCP